MRLNPAIRMPILETFTGRAYLSFKKASVVAFSSLNSPPNNGDTMNDYTAWIWLNNSHSSSVAKADNDFSRSVRGGQLHERH